MLGVRKTVSTHTPRLAIASARALAVFNELVRARGIGKSPTGVITCNCFIEMILLKMF
jgi:hypothetical protein